MKTKVCNKCGKEKPISEFHKNRNSKDGLNSWCKKCHKEYRDENKEKIKEKWREYYQNNRERISEYKKEYRKNNKEKIKEYNKEYRKKYPVKTWCQKTISSHKRSGYKVLFNWKDLFLIAKQTKYCPFCGVKLKWKYGIEQKDNSPSLDRIDNENILRLNNTQIICYKCNRTKSDRTIVELAKWCKRFLYYYNFMGKG